MGKHFKETIMFFSFQERKKRKFEKYLKERKMLEQLSISALSFEYIQTKTAYEHKKNVFGIFAISFLISIWMGVWKELLILIGKAAYYFITFHGNKGEWIRMMICLQAMIIIIFTVFFIVILRNYLQRIRKLYERILMLKEVQRKQEEKRKGERRILGECKVCR